jgi:sRNA-binding carbon storage regulator CsrA
VIQVHHGRVRLGIQAPPEVNIHREELVVRHTAGRPNLSVARR